MMNKILLVTLILPTIAFSQGYEEYPCDELIIRIDKPFHHLAADTLKPSPCEALDWYPAVKTLAFGPDEAFELVKLQVRVTTLTVYDPENCEGYTEVISRDTVELEREHHGVTPGEKTGGYWTIRFELRTTAVERRFPDCMATKLPSGKYKGYWVYHFGEYSNKADANADVKPFVRDHPEFPCAYPYYLPEGCEWQYIYNSPKSSKR
jgi:hypothetical protein